MTDKKPDAADNVIELGVPVEQVWQAITTPEGLRCFLADQADVEPGVGGHIQIGWDGQLMDPATIEVWEPGRRLRLRGNGVGEEWILESRGGRTVVRLVFSGYGDTDWDETYDAFDDTGALILQLLAAWLDEHAGTPPRQVKAIAHLSLERAAAWAAALGREGLATGAAREASLAVGQQVPLALRGGDPVPAVVRMYGHANEAFFAIPELDNARLLLMVRGADGSATLTLQLTTYGLDPSLVEHAHRRLIETAKAFESFPRTNGS